MKNLTVIKSRKYDKYCIIRKSRKLFTNNLGKIMNNFVEKKFINDFNGKKAKINSHSLILFDKIEDVELALDWLNGKLLMEKLNSHFN